METEVIEAKTLSFSILRKSANLIKAGGLVVYPTETCYGLGADPTSSKAVEEVYKVKNRPRDKPLPIAVSGLEQMKEYGKVDNKVEEVVKEFLPGPLTLILKKRGKLPSELSEKGVAFRIPDHPIPIGIIIEAGVPITSTSANISGEPPIYSAEEAKEVFEGKVDLILDAGELERTRPSTVLDLTGRKPKVLREGPISKAALSNFLNKPKL